MYIRNKLYGEDQTDSFIEQAIPGYLCVTIN
jgi:hypothetical protein